MKTIFPPMLLIVALSVAAQRPAAEGFASYIALLEGRTVGVTANHTTRGVNNVHLVDLLLANNIEVTKIYAPEHGFRGLAGEGEMIADTRDSKTGLPVISLYGNNKKPTREQLEGIDCMLFDLQDVGARFYTYLSTMHYVMEACAENGIPLIVLDRPNPNGFYVDGPVLEPGSKSFTGMHPIPVVHGMTLGELALMINGEHWLDNGLTCQLTVIPCSDYTHQSKYQLPVAPSPNLPDMQSVYLYPSLCFFEGTPLSVGRGSDSPFKIIGHPKFKNNSRYTITFTPEARGTSSSVALKGQLCYGRDFRDINTADISEINLTWLCEAYSDYSPKEEFFKPLFRKLAGNSILQRQIAEGLTVEEIRRSWKSDLDEFKLKRKKYLLYPDN